MKTFVVLGMHRSATSLVAKGLTSIVHMGDEMLGSGQFNPEGHFENMHFLTMNERILTAAGGDWKHPPPEEAILGLKKRFAEEIDRLVQQESRGRALWGWKDPRTTLTI